MASWRKRIALGAVMLSLLAVLGAATLRGRVFREACERGDWDKAIEIDPAFATAYNDRGNALYRQGAFEAAIADYTRAIELDPKYARAWLNRGITRGRKGDLDGAIADTTRAIELEPQWAPAYYNRGNARKTKGDLEGAVADYTRTVEIEPDFGRACISLAWILATAKDERLRDGRRAIDLARQAGLQSEREEPSIYDTLAAAYAEAGKFDRAAKTQEEAIKLIPAGDAKRRAEFEARIELYRAGKPYREK